MGVASKPVLEWNVGTLLGEGPLWRAPENALWFTDIKGKTLHRYVPSTGEKRIYAAPSSPGFIVHDGMHHIVGLEDGLHRFDPATGAFTLWHAVEPDKPGNRLNDATIDRQSRLWFGTMDNAEASPAGSLYRLDADGPKALDRGMVVTNGPCVSPDGRILYHADSVNQVIHAYDIADDSSLGGKRVFITIDNGYPDGAVVDAEGCLWTALWDGWSVRRYAPDGRLLETVEFPVARVTKIAFAGGDLRTVYVTTAKWNLSDEQRAAQPLAGALFRFESTVPGL